MSGTAPHSWDDGYMPQPFRLQGFRRALAEFGVSSGEEWFFQNASYEMGGAEMARRFLEMEDRPTGLCIVNDYVALAFLVEVMRAGLRVPEDVSVVSHDNQPVALFCPVPLTSVSHPVEAIAQTVVEMLIERLEGSDAPPRTVTIQGELVQRESVAAPSL
jgi:DNA-binding LacI/PurR family transcriptional regulator